MLCKVTKVSRSGYYAWCKRQPSRCQRANEKLWAAIKAVYKEGRGYYGYRRIYKRLRELGYKCSRNRVARLMKKHGLCVKRKRSFRRTTQSKHNYPIAPNRLGRDFSATAPNQKWAADITYVATAEGWLYLAVVIDLYSRRVVGWAMDTHLRTSLVIRALQMALMGRRIQPGLIHHSDRGSQYASHAYQALLAEYGMQASMSRRGDCYDNAPVESFFATLKREGTQNRVFATRQAAKLALFEYMVVFYNRRRLHSTLGYCSPHNFEQHFFSQLAVH